MTQSVTDLQQQLKRLGDEISAWDPADDGKHTAFVSGLQTILEQTPDSLRDMRVVLQLALEAMVALSDLAVEERQDLIEPILSALTASAQYLLAEHNPQRVLPVKAAARDLLRALGRESEEWELLTAEPLCASEERAEFSLDDVAALLIQLEPTDTEEMTRIRDALAQIGTAAGQTQRYPESTTKFAAEAAKKLDRVIQGKSAKPQNELTEVGWLIEGAIDALSESPRAASREEVQQPIPVSEAAETPTLVLLPEHSDIELIADFITESREYIERAEAALLDLEVNPEDMEAVNTVFRAFHTVKGTAGFLGLSMVSEMAHHAESLLSRMRDGEIRCAGGYADLALRSVDMLKEVVQALQDALGGDAQTPPHGFTELLHALADPEGEDILAEDAAISPPRPGDISVAEGVVSREDVEATVAMQGEVPLGITRTRSENASLPAVGNALRSQRRMASGEHGVESSVRIRTDRLDRLIDMVGELVIAHAMVAQDERVLQGGHHDLLKKISHAGKIVRELQDLSMSMRMVPFKATFQKLARVVRDIAQKSSRTVHFITDGEDTEIDRNMVDIIADPLVHMVRNAVDHGIEAPAEREKNHKPLQGTVRLSAYHAGGNVVVQLKDDGRGLNRDKIIEKALSKGLIESDKGMSDTDVFNLILEAGFSTAEQVTDVSGRGVGMDVVKRGIEALHGRMDITSESGKGTTFSIRLPLTLAITDGMLIRVGRERYIIPTINIYMNFRPRREAVSTIAGRGEMVMLRDELIPLVRLHRLFNIPDAIEDPTQGLLVVVNDGERHCALLVDELLGQQQVVAKSLGAGIGAVPGVSGAAILGDGRVGLILDPSGTAALARQIPSAYRKGTTEPSASLFAKQMGKKCTTGGSL